MKSKVYKKEKINIIELSGSYRQIGRDYGTLLKDDLNRFYNVAIEEHFIKEDGLSYELIQELTWAIYRLYPRRYKEIFSGMSETSNMPVEKLVILDHVIAIHFISGEDIVGCSCIACWNDYTAGGPLVFGRNFDFPEYYKKFGEFATLIIIKPDDKSVPTASFGYAGQISVNTAMNSAGFFLANNEAVASAGSTFRPDIRHGLISELSFLLNYSGMSDFDRVIRTTQSNGPIVVNVADEKAAYSYEWPPFGLKKRVNDREGLLISTNHYLHPSWGIPEPGPHTSEKTIERRANLLAIAEKYKGEFTADKMIQVLDLPLSENGATHFDKTIYQVVAVPETRIFHIKLPGFQDWIEVDLKPYFGPI